MLAFESGVVVIKHWLIHNTIRMDRYHETQYLDEKSTLKIKDNKSYTEKNKGELKEWQPSGNQMEAQVKLSQVKPIKKNVPGKPGEYDPDFLKWYEIYPRKVGKPRAYKAWKKINPSTELKRKMVTAILNHAQSQQWQDEQYIPHPATWLNDERWETVMPKAKQKEKTPHYQGMKIVYRFGKRYVNKGGEWFEFAGKESDIEML